MNYPKITIITPSFNQAQYLEETILSVIEQGYPNLEYIIIDGGSTDGSVDIIKKYADKLTYWVSEPDKGMYDALQKGFARSTGDMMGWVNSDDILHKNSLFIIAELLRLPGVNWIQALPSVIDERSRIVQAISFGPWSRLRHYIDDVCIQQDATFWNRSLWNKAGGYISAEFRLAGDFELWNRFFKYEQLYTPSCLVASFRIRTSGQLSLTNTEEYWREAKMAMEKNADTEIQNAIQKLKKLHRRKKFLSRTRIFNLIGFDHRIDKAIDRLHHFPEQIAFDRETQKFKLMKRSL